MNRKLPGVLIAVLAAAAAAAQESPPAPAASPCSVLTVDDVKSALGGDWQVWQDMGSEEVCVYQASPTSMVTLTLFHDPVGAEKILEVRRQLAGAGVIPVVGLGPGAFRLQMSTANTIAFGKGQTAARVEMSHQASADVAVLEKLARTIYARLP